MNAGSTSKRTIKKIMLVNRKAPHGTIYAQESLEVALVAGAFDQDVSMVFMDDGVYQLASGQDTRGIGTKEFAKTFNALKDYDISKLYVELESMRARGLTTDDLIVPAETVDARRLGELMDAQNHVLSF